MSEPTSNPFVLPGLGQGGDLSGNPLLASMEMMRKAWSGLAGPGGLAQSLPMTPPMNLEDLERRIADLRTIESWLRMNLSMLSSTIQGLEVQRATIATLRSFVNPAAAGGDASPLEVALGLKPAPAAQPPAGQQKPADAPQPESGPATTAEQVNQAAQSASQAWWNLLQQQFNQIAAATAATLPESAAVPPAAPADPPAGGPARPDGDAAAPRKRAPRKAAAKRAPAPRKS
ncbi:MULTISPECIES: PhaM family polyhydroxyalkanoate granule multifunctional regulatory protein [Bordetella]|uniref:Transcriptional regulator n=1 Tax=Bordetella genomosp. 2 TaxID=1983456 RepID=A0A261W8V6_9BORD|nr:MULTISPECIES: PhaM family polyhydroxyalkanoate granule multifunctional regulatory protein [Bordetella]OZI82481.1 transcriptional regulator [Bordetella genomosp. 2]